MNYLFSYSGPVSFKIKRQLLRNIKSNTEAVTTNPAIQKRIRYIFDEMVSNVYEYYVHEGFSAEITGIDGHLKLNNQLEFVLTSTIGEADKEPFKNHIDYVNSLDEAGLKSFYKIKLNAVDTEKGKVGLGLLSVRMKSGNPIEYEFKTTKSGNMLFLKTVINLKNE